MANKDIISTLLLLVGVITLIKVIIEYRNAQKWKRAEFLAKEIKEFLNDNSVKRILLILDWNIVDIILFENEIPTNKLRSFVYNDTMLLNALKHHNETLFDDEESIIRQSMDVFFDKLSLLQNYVESNLIETNDLKPYLFYWINLLGNKNSNRKQIQVINQLHKFLKNYEYNQVINLLSSFGYKI